MQVATTELYNYWRSGSPWKGEAENMADFGLCWRHMVPSATGIYHWPTAMLCFWQSPSPPGFYRKKLWLSCFRDKSSGKKFFFRLLTQELVKIMRKCFFWQVRVLKLVRFLSFYPAKCTFPFPKVIEMVNIVFVKHWYKTCNIKKSRHKELFNSLVIYK